MDGLKLGGADDVPVVVVVAVEQLFCAGGWVEAGRGR